jgi:hypothetical protein
MTALVWDKIDERHYEFGIDRGVLYDVEHTKGVVWNGLVSVDEARVGGDFESLSYDDIKYLDTVTTSDFQLVLSAFSMPIEFMSCLGNPEVVPGFYLTRQRRTSFGLSYRTQKSDGTYKIHLVYNATVAPSSSSSETAQENTEPKDFKWTIDTRPSYEEDYRPSSHFVVDSGKVTPESLDILEGILYGSSGLLIIDGGTPTKTGPEVISGGDPNLYPWDVVINGGTPNTNSYAYPTLPPPGQVMSILEGV